MSIDIVDQRLDHQKLTRTTFSRPEQVIKWLGAVQAQDYAAAKWAVAQRTHGLTDAMMDQALAEGTILRTHILRPTWHFVTPEDIRWMLTFSAPRINAFSAPYYRKLELDEAVFKRTHAILIKTLQGGKQLTRAELSSVLKKNGIAGDALLRFTYLIMHAELDGILCSGARRGKQFTYALLDERVPAAKAMSPDEASAELAKRYFSSHGPATVKDYAWWSGLSVQEASRGLERVRSQLHHEIIGDKTYWFTESEAALKTKNPTAHLLPNYDEYIVGYTDRSAIYDSKHNTKLDARGNFLFNNVIVINGQVAGTWKRTVKKNSAAIELHPFRRLTKAEKQAVDSALDQYGLFLELPVKHT
jgi:Winged helix DNA-binding domain